MLHCIYRLQKLPITIDLLKATEIGLTMNGLRKCEGQVGCAASTLVIIWKKIVADEMIEGAVNEEEGRVNSNTNSVQRKEVVSHNLFEEPSEKQPVKQAINVNQQRKERSSQRQIIEEKKIDNLSHPQNQVKQEPEPSSSKNTITKNSSERPLPKKRKLSSTEEIVIDSTMGASFADALGIIGCPSVKRKKSTLLAKLSKTSTKTADLEHKTKSTESENSSLNVNKEVTAPLLLRQRPSSEALPKLALEISNNMTSTAISDNQRRPHSLSSTKLVNQSKQSQSIAADKIISYNMQSRKERTKVFSGSRAYQRHEVPKLYDLCIRWLQEHIDGRFQLSVQRSFK